MRWRRSSVTAPATGFGFVKRYRIEDPKIQQEVNIALRFHARKGNERGVALCFWAGADPHAPSPDLESGISEDPDGDDGDERFIGWSAVQGAALAGHLGAATHCDARPDVQLMSLVK
jgi:hypothetical protein